VIGLGYIGLPTASLLATKGFNVQGCDTSDHVVETINSGKIHIVENDLDVLVKSAVNSSCLRAYSEPQPADVFIIAVPTPLLENNKPDLSYIHSATQAVAPKLQKGNLIVLESTSPVGTTENIAEWLQQYRPDLKVTEEIFLAHCPERVLPGQILKELVINPRIIGGINEASTLRAKEFYETFVQGELLMTNARTAELAKLAENAFRDVNIAFANELSSICLDLKIDVWDLIRLTNHHPRVNILKPGPGVGGHCIAVDPWFIVDAAPYKASLIKPARKINDSKPYEVVSQITTAASKFKKPKIACFGLTYKADIDDMRESPSLIIVKKLVEDNIGELFLVDPHIQKLPQKILDSNAQLKLVSTQAGIEASDIVVMLVDHKEFKNIDKQLLNQKILIDTRGIWK
jgi:UDP-N-acetyl-D-mannosaminuronic acid dehydrogenase